MPEGTFLGIDRPFVEGELIIETAYSVTDDLGLGLDNKDARLEFEKEASDFLNRETLDIQGTVVYNVKASPAGNTLGLSVGTETSELPGNRFTSRKASLESIIEALEKMPSEVEGITGFRVSTMFRSFGDSTNELVYSIRVK